MKRWLILAILLIATSAWAGPPKINGTTVSKIDGLAAAKCNGLAGPSAISCTGDFASAGDEHFESGAGSFCTSNMTENDANSVLSTYSTADYVTGTHCQSVVESGTRYYAWSYGTAAGDTTNGDSWRFYFKAPSFTSDTINASIAFVASSNSNPGTNYAAGFRWGRFSGVYRLDALGTSTVNGPTLSANTWYRVEAAIKRNAASTLKIFSIGGSQVGSTVNFTARDYDVSYWAIGVMSASESTPSWSVFFDNAKLVRGSMSDVGVDE